MCGFRTTPVRYAVREVLALCILKPAFDSMSDPDFVNTNLEYWVRW
jgi:hypothetical protein